MREQLHPDGAKSIPDTIPDTDTDTDTDTDACAGPCASPCARASADSITRAGCRARFGVDESILG